MGKLYKGGGDRYICRWFWWRQVQIYIIDQGTSSTRFVLVTKNGDIAASAQREFTQIYPTNTIGWHEHDPIEIWQSVKDCINALIKTVNEITLNNNSSWIIASIGIANQRETIIAWIMYKPFVWSTITILLHKQHWWYLCNRRYKC